MCSWLWNLVTDDIDEVDLGWPEIIEQTIIQDEHITLVKSNHKWSSLWKDMMKVLNFLTGLKLDVRNVSDKLLAGQVIS